MKGADFYRELSNRANENIRKKQEYDERELTLDETMDKIMAGIDKYARSGNYALIIGDPWIGRYKYSLKDMHLFRNIIRLYEEVGEKLGAEKFALSQGTHDGKHGRRVTHVEIRWVQTMIGDMQVDTILSK
jgi:hypothetical protein